MEQENICARCRYFDRYFIKETKHFKKTELGRCAKKDGQVSAHGGCEQFLRGTCQKKSRLLLRCALSELLTEISEIRKMMETEDEDVQKM